MPHIERHYSGAPWEKKYGYCRALRTGNRILVSGTSPIDPDGRVVHPGDPVAQTRLCYRIIENALAALRCDRTCLVRVRLFVTDISRCEEHAAAHAEFFGSHHPVMTMVEIPRLIDPAMMVEVEAEGVTD